jgi:23S rRNA-intervening sequence protein
MFGFEKLDVWQLAIEFSDEIYSTSRSFPSDERFDRLYNAADRLARMLSGLKNSLDS